MRLVDWDRLAHALDDALGLPFGAAPDETERALAIERALDARAAAHPDLAHPLRSDPFGVALALLRVVDTLRLHNWRGVTPRFDASDRAARLVASHVSLLGELARELEAQLVARGQLDTIARLRRAIPAIAKGAQLPFTALVVEGTERLAPLERDVLMALRERGVDVDVAPWVEGWSHATPVADDVFEEATTLLHALDRGAKGVSVSGRGVAAVRARDPHDEAEQVARWIAECVARGARPEDFAVHVSAESGALDRVRRALARYEVAGHGVGVSPVRQSVPWQVLRASVRLGWRGVDVVDLATVLSAPGSGIWGSDRDWLCAQLRKDVPTSWKARARHAPPRHRGAREGAREDRRRRRGDGARARRARSRCGAREAARGGAKARRGAPRSVGVGGALREARADGSQRRAPPRGDRHAQSVHGVEALRRRARRPAHAGRVDRRVAGHQGRVRGRARTRGAERSGAPALCAGSVSGDGGVAPRGDARHADSRARRGRHAAGRRRVSGGASEVPRGDGLSSRALPLARGSLARARSAGARAPRLRGWRPRAHSHRRGARRARAAGDPAAPRAPHRAARARGPATHRAG